MSFLPDRVGNPVLGTKFDRPAALAPNTAALKYSGFPGKPL